MKNEFLIIPAKLLKCENVPQASSGNEFLSPYFRTILDSINSTKEQPPPREA